MPTSIWGNSAIWKIDTYRGTFRTSVIFVPFPGRKNRLSIPGSMSRNYFIPVFFFLTLLARGQNTPTPGTETALIAALETAATQELLEKWYPLAVDFKDGGYFSDITYDFKIGEHQDKMIVTQARHLWTTAMAAREYPENTAYKEYAAHGFAFLKDVLWDKQLGGFHTLVTKKGKPIPREGEAKTAYGNAFAIYALSAYFDATGDNEALDLARKTFYWLETNSHDPLQKGYYQSLEPEGTPILRTEAFPTTSDIGYKDQNSSIHLLEAFTSLYNVWPNDLLAQRLNELLELIRDTITTEKGYMHLYFDKDWKPVSYRYNTPEVIAEHYYLDHVSFGHDVETAYLMLEASHALGGTADEQTLARGKVMVDHALRTGWDNEKGGFYDGGYYFGEADTLTLVNTDKNWWTQAEGLNTLLMLSYYFPDDPMDYRGHFNKLWSYIHTYLMDPDHGGWYEWGTDQRPDSKEGLKGHIWKATYHDYRALLNCKKRLEARGK